MALESDNCICMTNENNVTGIMDDKGFGEGTEAGNQSLTTFDSENLSPNPEIKLEELVISSNFDGIFNKHSERASNMGNRMSPGVCILPAQKVSPVDCSGSLEENMSKQESPAVSKGCLNDSPKKKKNKSSKERCLGMPTKIFATGSMFPGEKRAGKGDQDYKSPAPTEENSIINEDEKDEATGRVSCPLPAAGDYNIPETLKKPELNASEMCGKPSILSIERKLSYLSVPPFDPPELESSLGEKTKSTDSPSRLSEGAECILADNEKSSSPTKDRKDAKVNYCWWKFELGCRKQKLQANNRKFAFGKKD